MKHLIHWIVVATYLPAALAQGLSDREVRPSSTTAEYVFKSTYQENLIPVQVLGAIHKPGMYFVPSKTDLVKLLTMAGGPTTAVSEDIVVRKTDRSWSELNLIGLKKENQAYEVNFKKLLRGGAYTTLLMSPHDVVYVPPTESWVDTNTMRLITVVSLVMGIVVTGIAIDQKTD